MNHQRMSPPNGTASTITGLIVKNKKRKRKFFQVNNNAVSSFTKNTSAITDKDDDFSKSVQPTKKRKRKNKKKTPEEGSQQTFKPVLVVKSPEDYSANWKKLKEIIAPEDKKKTSDKPVTSKNIDKYNRNVKYMKSRGRHQSTDEMESAVNEAENQEAPNEEKLDIWFDNVDPILLEPHIHNQNLKKPGITKNNKTLSKTLVKEECLEGPTKVIAMDCEMVGVGMNGKDSILARVSIVNQYGKVLFDKFVKPTEEVVDYRTAVSGIRPADIVNGCDFSSVQKEVSDLIEGRILVGHAIRNDLRVLYLSHPRCDIRDTSKFKGFVRQFGGRTPSLKKLVERFLGVQIQQGEHNSVEDAQAAIRIYNMHRREWEKSRPNKYKRRHMVKKDKTSASMKEGSSEASKVD